MGLRSPIIKPSPLFEISYLSKETPCSTSSMTVETGKEDAMLLRLYSPYQKEECPASLVLPAPCLRRENCTAHLPRAQTIAHPLGCEKGRAGPGLTLKWPTLKGRALLGSNPLYQDSGLRSETFTRPVRIKPPQLESAAFGESTDALFTIIGFSEG